MIPGNSPPLRSCRPASGSSASTSQSRASVLARAMKEASDPIGLDCRFRPRTCQQGRRTVGPQRVEAIGKRDLRVQVEKMFLDGLLLETSRAQPERKTCELPVGERQHRQLALLTRGQRQRGCEQRQARMVDRQGPRGFWAQGHDEARQQAQSAGALFIALPQALLDLCDLLVRSTAAGTKHDQSGVEEIARQFTNRQLHAPLLLHEARLRSQDGYRQSSDLALPGGG